jgi:hypothetical protein
MKTKHNIRSADDQLYVRLASIGAGVYNSMLGKLLLNLPLNYIVRLKEQLKLDPALLMYLTELQ